ncbi:hypothetical protein [Leifsonia aquatica]|uniref:hypothetical protein n=1 Tax=Leifsonia aquatica TaxID=144185 RepID=UPI0028AE0071|nr:hypothetical protein [Leifsonia aquatica]
MGRLEDIPFDEQVSQLNDAAQMITEVVNEKGPISSEETLREVHQRHSISDSQLRYGLSYAQSSGQIRRDYDTWNLISVQH